MDKLSSDVFNNSLEELLIAYGDQGFTMNIAKNKLWYKHFQHFNDQDFIAAVDCFMKVSKFIPTIADIYKFANDIRNPYERVGCDE